MATPFVTPTAPNLLPKRKKFNDLASSLTGATSAFSPAPTQGTPTLPENYGFGELAGYEETRRNQFGDQSKQSILDYGKNVGQMGQDLRGQIQKNQAQIPGLFDQSFNRLTADTQNLEGQLRGFGQEQQGQISNFFDQGTNRLTSDTQNLQNQLRGLGQDRQGQISGLFNEGTGRLASDAQSLQDQLKANTAARQQAIQGYVGDFGSRASDRRAQLSQSLANIGQQQFSMANPGILEDLQRRGFSSSPTEMANAQTQALKEIALQNQRDVLGVEQGDIANEERLRELGLQQSLSGEDSDVARDVFSRRQGLSQGLLESQMGASGQTNSDLSNVAKDQLSRRQALSQGLMENQLGASNQLTSNLSGVAKDQLSRRQALSESLLNRQLGGVDELSALDKDLFGRQADIQGSAVGAQLQGQQDALDAGLDLRRGGLEAQIANANAAREEALARDLAKDQRKSGITNSLIGAGGSVLGGALMGGGAGAAGGAAGLLPALGPAALAVGGTMAYQKLNDTGKALIAPMVRPDKTVKSIGKAVGKSIKKLCFDGETLIEMADGMQKKIKDVCLGEDTKGGIVFKTAASITDPGTRYNYLGTVVTGSHAVKEHGRWKRVENATYSVPIEGGGIVYSLGTEDHRIYVSGTTFADELEVDEYEEITMVESLDKLNEQETLEVR